jgi:DNA-binding beta-propeller fold protein YncE
VIPSTTVIVVADSDNTRIRLVTYPGGVVTTLAGSGSNAFADGTGASASFFYVYGVAVDPFTDRVYVADVGNNRIRQITLPYS